MRRYGEGPGVAAHDDEDAHDEDDRAARRTIRLGAVALFVVVIAVVLRLSLLALDDNGSTSSKRSTNQAQAGPVMVEDLGPVPGVELAAYSRNRRAALAAVTGDRVAVASLNAYSTEATVKALAGPLTIVALLVAPPDTAPSTVVGGLGPWADGQATKIREERDEIEKLIPTVTDSAFTDFYTAEVDRLDKAASALTPGSPVVFAAVVRGPAAALQALGARTEVRLVDVGEGARATAQATFRGLRPEEKSTTGDPPIRPAA